MAVIRSAESHAARRAVSLDLGDLARRGELMREAALAESRRIVSDAHAERERLVSNAHAAGLARGLVEGHARGLPQGREQGRREAAAAHAADLEALIANWSSALQAFERDRDDLLLDARTSVVRLAAAIASRVVKRVVELDPGVVAAQLESVLALAIRPHRLVVRVHPDDEPLARERLAALMRRLDASAHASLETDPTLSRASCVAQSPGGGVIDASVDTQLDRIVSLLLPGPQEAPDASPGG